MDRVRGYQTLAMLLKKKRHLLNAHILHLTFALVGTVGDQLPRGSGKKCHAEIGTCHIALCEKTRVSDFSIGTVRFFGLMQIIDSVLRPGTGGAKKG